MSRQTATDTSQARKIKTLDATLARYSRNIASLEKEVARLTAIAQAPSTPNLKEELETLKTSVTHTLSSEQEMRAFAQETEEEWERVERALRDENIELRGELDEASRELKTVKEELNGKKAVPFVRQLLQERGRILEVVRSEDDTREQEAEMSEGAADVQVIFDGLALQRLESVDLTSGVPDPAGASAFRRRLAPELATLERATVGLQQALSTEIRSAYARSSWRLSTPMHMPRNDFRTARDFRLLVVLWEANEIEGLKGTLTSIIEKCTPAPTPEQSECLICTDLHWAKNMITVEGCRHMMCMVCFQEYIRVKLGEKIWPILCPICMTESGLQRRPQVITRLLVDELHLPADILDQWTEFELSQFLIHIDCAVCGKQCLYDLTDFDRSKILVCTHNPEHSFCRDCRTGVLQGSVHDRACGDAALEKLAGERKWVRCPRPSCNVMVERVAGCDNMTCRCGMFFCYRCGGSKMQGNHHCRPLS